MTIDPVVGRPANRSWKLEPPPIREPLLARPRLLEKLDDALGKRAPGGSIFLVTAPPGFGKSTMLAQWMQQASMPTAWLHLDVGDDDPATLARNLTQALRRLAPRSAPWQATASLLRMHEGALTPAEVARVAEALAAEIGEYVTRPSVLTLTGATELSQASGACALLDALLARPVDHLRIILESREAPQLTFSQAQAQRRLYGLGAQELTLTAEELEDLLTLIDAPDDADYRAAIRDLCAGWITGVLLATGALWPKELPPRFIAEDETAAGGEVVNRKAIADYLAHEVLASLGEDELAFALRAATLAYMTVPLCERLLDEPEARLRLFQLERRTGLVTRIGRRPDEARYRFQPFLRAALLKRLADEPQGAVLRRDLHARAGQLLEEFGDLDEALAQHGEAQQFYHMVAIIEGARGALLRGGQGATLERWVHLLPDHVREGQPHLITLLAELARQQGRMDEAYERANHACALTEPLREAEPQMTSRALAVRADIHFTRGEYAACQRDEEAALAGAPTDDSELPARARFTLAQSLSKQGRLDAAVECLGPAEPYCHDQGDLWLLARLAYFRSQLLVAQGDYQAAGGQAQEALRYGQEANDEIIVISARLQLGALGPYLGQAGQARQQLELALEHAEQCGYLAGQAYARVNLADLALRVGEYPQAAALYAFAIAAMSGLADQWLTIYAHAQRAIALALADAGADAATALTALLALPQRQEASGVDATQVALARGLVAWRQGAPQAAIEHLDAAAQIAQNGKALGDYVSAHVYQTVVLCEQGRQSEAVLMLAKACETTLTLVGGHVERAALAWLDAAYHSAARQTLALVAHPVATAALALMETLTTSMSDATERREEQPTQRQRRSLVAASQASIGDLAYAPQDDFIMHIHTLGEARVHIGAQVIDLWRRPQAQELLLYLADRGRPTRKDRILLDLWPERSQEQAERAFKKARHNLRELMNCECLAQQNDLWFLAMDCWLDTHAFEEQMNEGMALFEQEAYTAAANAFQGALSHWRGLYLAEAYSGWIVLRREQLRLQYLLCLERAAEVELACQRWENAAKLCHRILETDEVNENAYRGLMSVAALKGAYGEAAQLYQRCLTIVREVLDVDLDPKTHALWRNIQSRSRRRAPGRTNNSAYEAAPAPRSIADGKPDM